MKKINFFSKILTGIITVAIVAVVAFLALNNRKTKLYSDSSTTGNTACNLLNGGLFTPVSYTHLTLPTTILV